MDALLNNVTTLSSTLITVAAAISVVWHLFKRISSIDTRLTTLEKRLDIICNKIEKLEAALGKRTIYEKLEEPHND